MSIFFCCRRQTPLSKENYNEGLQCDACKNPLIPHVFQLACGHCFHAQCFAPMNFNEALAVHDKCPLCRREITWDSLPRIVYEPLKKDQNCDLCHTRINKAIRRSGNTIYLENSAGQKFHKKCAPNGDQYITLRADTLPGPKVAYYRTPEESSFFSQLMQCVKDWYRFYNQ